MEMPDTEISFEKTDFGTGAISFNSVRCNMLSLRSVTWITMSILGCMELIVLDLSDSIVRDIIDLEPYER